MNGVEVLRLKTPQTKDVGYARRTLAEFLMPFAMLLSLRKSPLANVQWQGVIWYAPTLFLGPICVNQSVGDLAELLTGLVEDIAKDAELPLRCKALSSKLFAPEKIALQITSALRQPSRA